MAEQRYNEDAVRAILKRTVDFHEDEVDFTRQQLLDIGLEAGLTEDAIVKAEREWLASQATPPPHDSLKAQFERERRTEYARQVLLYLIAMGVLFSINLVTGLAFPWFLFPLLGAGAGVVVRGEQIFGERGMKYEAEWEQWKARYQRRTHSSETNHAFQDQRLHHQFREARRAAYRLRIAQYVLGMLFLAILNFIIMPHYPWVMVPLLGATIGIVVEGLAVYQNVGEQYEQAFTRWLTHRARQHPL